MSCRSTSGGAASTSLARIVTGLEDKEIQHIFHALKREGADMPPPSEFQVSEWRARQYDLLDRATRMSDSKRDGLRDKLFRSRSEPTPDGGTFYAWSRVETRARQEVAIRSITDVIDLDPPGSHAHLYEFDEDGKPKQVWYASYGSNLHRDRFLTYIEGGSPEGSTRVYAGCRDVTPPEEDIAIRVPGARPHFALTSRVWGGGIAFFDAHKGETATGLGRAYSVTREQFEDVVAQENGMWAGECADIPYDEVLTTGRVVTGQGPYETLLHVGDYNGAPVLTFTAPFSTRDALGRKGQVTRAGVRMPVLTNKPSPAYLRMIGSGLKETFDMDEVAQADYLRGCPGGERYSRQQVVQILRTENPPPSPITSYGSGSSSWSSRSPSGFTARKPEPHVVVDKVDPPAKRPVVATERALYPAVKAYACGEDAEVGVRRWNSLLRESRKKRDRLKKRLESGRTSGWTEDQWAHYAAETRVAYEEEAHRVNELNAKVRYAKSQTPTVYYPPADTATATQWHWRRRTVENEIRAAEGDVRYGMQRVSWYSPGGDFDTQGTLVEHQRQKAEKEVEKAREKLATLQSRLAELDERVTQTAE